MKEENNIIIITVAGPPKKFPHENTQLILKKKYNQATKKKNLQSLCRFRGGNHPLWYALVSTEDKRPFCYHSRMALLWSFLGTYDQWHRLTKIPRFLKQNIPYCPKSRPFRVKQLSNHRKIIMDKESPALNDGTTGS